jgi:HAD superfamily hydrolase (TIGR01509 family)
MDAPKPFTRAVLDVLEGPRSPAEPRKALLACVARGDTEGVQGPAPRRGRVTSTAFVFDLDGTLVDSVYQHVLAWRDALETEGIELAAWRVHRRIGMSGGLMARALLRETGRPVSATDAERLQRAHEAAYRSRIGSVRPLPGASELLAHLSAAGAAWAIATSGRRAAAAPTVELLGLDSPPVLVTRDEAPRAKPDPDLFLTAASRLGVDITDTIVVGDSFWDMLAAVRGRFLGVGVLSGGYGEDELMRAGAMRVYDDPAGLLAHLDELGVREA